MLRVWLKRKFYLAQDEMIYGTGQLWIEIWSTGSRSVTEHCTLNITGADEFQMGAVSIGVAPHDCWWCSIVRLQDEVLTTAISTAL